MEQRDPQVEKSTLEFLNKTRGYTICGKSTWLPSEQTWVYCTNRENHTDDHIARGWMDDILAQWPNEPKTTWDSDYATD